MRQRCIFKNRTWYHNHENSVKHCKFMVSTGVRMLHNNKETFGDYNTKHIHWINSGCFSWPQWQPLLWASCSVLAAEAAGIRNTKLLILQIARHGAIDCHTLFRLELQMAPEICNAFHIKRMGKPGQNSVHVALSQVCYNKLRIVGCAVAIHQN